jgi:xanthine dehydrogenase FAD-binding subunit
MDIATLGTSVNVRLSEDGRRVERCRIAFGVAGPVPLRAETAEAAANGQPLSEELAQRVSKAVLEDINPRDSWRAAKDFRKHIAVESARRAFLASVELAGGVL